jgi:hypothetical protein
MPEQELGLAAVKMPGVEESAVGRDLMAAIGHM